MKNPNNFSYWFEKIKNITGLRIPKSIWFDVPAAVQRAFYLEGCLEERDDMEVIDGWLKKEVIPEIKKNFTTPFFFVKNGTFSNKFSSNGFNSVASLLSSVIDLNYNALCFGAEGTDELVIREYIRADDSVVPKIYSGLPLRPEFRVFYDFDARKVEYSANYWDPAYVMPHLYSVTDKIVFKEYKDTLCEKYFQHKEYVENLVASSLKDVDMSGVWSVDVMLQEDPEEDVYWLIDMARAEESAYWINDRDYDKSYRSGTLATCWSSGETTELGCIVDVSTKVIIRTLSYEWRNQKPEGEITKEYVVLDGEKEKHPVNPDEMWKELQKNGQVENMPEPFFN